jgi:hypothetical protein
MGLKGEKNTTVESHIKEPYYGVKGGSLQTQGVATTQ